MAVATATFTVALSPPGPATAAGTLVAEALTNTTTIAPGLTLGQTVTGAEGATVHVLQGDLGDRSLHLKYLGNDHVTDRATVATMANRDGAVAAVNGDFFNMGYTDAPNGTGIDDGVLRNGRLSGYNDAAAVFADGTGDRAALAQVFLDATITLPDGRTLTGTNLNSPRITSNGIGIYNELWGGTSRTTTTAQGTRIRQVEVANGVVTGVADSATGAVAAGSVMLVGIDAGADALAPLVRGDAVAVNYQARGADGAQSAIGGNQVLLRDGVVTTATSDRQPRTAIGFSADGLRVWMIAADGTSGHGLSYQEEGALLRDFGADDALNLDGGGSTNMVARLPGASTATVVNVPSVTPDRPVPNAIGFFSTARSTVCHTPASFFAGESDGSLDLYRLNSPGTTSTSWSGPDTIGQGWTAFPRVLGGPGGRLYGINSSGMFRYRWRGLGVGWDYANGSYNYQIGTAEQFARYGQPAWRDKVTVDTRGDFYLIGDGGALLLYRYDEASRQWTIRGQVVDGAGWDRYDLIVAADVGVIYARAAVDGTLYRYRYDADTGRWLLRELKVGDDWGRYSYGIVSAGGDTLYGIRYDGHLIQYRYREWDGSWPILNRDIGRGWQQFVNVAATTDTCTLTSTVFAY